MAFENNRTILTQVVAEKSVIRHVSKHRNPDGTMDVAGNKKLWNDAIARFEQVKLWENGTPGYDDRDPLQPEPSIIFVPSTSKTPRGTIVVAHGGGFETRTGCEGMHIADFFNQAGFNTAILTYRLRPYTRRDAMADMHRAVRVLRAHQAAWNITDKVAVMGFSAGGMLSGNCATHFDYGDPDAADPIERFSCRPDASCVCYGAFSSVAFPGGFGRRKASPEEQAENVYLAPERNITVETPPFFIWQTNSDDPRTSMNLAWNLQCVGIPFELYCFTSGVHGLALADGNNDLSIRIPHLMHWAEMCAEWLEDLGI